MSVPMGIAGGVMSIVGGFAKAKGLNREAKELEYNAKIQKLQGKQTSHLHREELNGQLATLEVLRASRGLDESANSLRIRGRNIAKADRNENTDVLNSKLKEDALRRQAAGKKRAAPFALAGGIISGVGTIASTIEDAAAKAMTGGTGGAP